MYILPEIIHWMGLEPIKKTPVTLKKLSTLKHKEKND